MTDKLTSNVEVDGTWYGPDYPQNGEPPAGSVTNPAAFASATDAAAESASAVDLRTRRDDFGLGDDDEVPSLRANEQAALVAAGGGPVGTAPPRTGAGSGRDAWAAFAAANGVDVGEDSKPEIIATLEARGLVEPE